MEYILYATLLAAAVCVQLVLSSSDPVNPVRLNYKQALNEFIERRIVASSLPEADGSGSYAYVRPVGLQNPFVAAVHMAYLYKRPLALSPDMLWTAVLQGLGLLVKNNSLTSNESQSRLEIATYNNEELVDAEFPSLAEDVAVNFTTTSAASSVAADIASEDKFLAVARYRARVSIDNDEVHLAVSLQGTAEDWTELREQVVYLFRERFMVANNWAYVVEAILDRFCAEANGTTTEELTWFWDHTYSSSNQASFPEIDVVSGWIIALYPYIFNETGRHIGANNCGLNPYVDYWYKIFSTGVYQFDVNEGIYDGELLTGMTVLKTLSAVAGVGLVGGFIGVKEDINTGALSPVLGWAAINMTDDCKITNNFCRHNCACSGNGVCKPSPLFAFRPPSYYTSSKGSSCTCHSDYLGADCAQCTAGCGQSEVLKRPTCDNSMILFGQINMTSPPVISITNVLKSANGVASDRAQYTLDMSEYNAAASCGRKCFRENRRRHVVFGELSEQDGTTIRVDTIISRTRETMGIKGNIRRTVQDCQTTEKPIMFFG